MTTQPFKFRHLDSIVGAFVLGVVGIILAAILLMGSAKQWFTLRTVIPAATAVADPAAVEFLDELSESLRAGTPVEFAGAVVGQVVAAHSEAGHLRMELSIANTTLARLRPDAKALIKVPLAPFMGQTRVVLKPGRLGDPGWAVQDPPTLIIDPPRDSTAMAMVVLRDLQSNIGPMVRGITGLVEESRTLVSEIRTQRLPQQAGELIAGIRERQVPQRLDALLARIETIATSSELAAADVRRITGALAEGKGIAGKALTDAQLASDLTQIAGDLRAITAELRKAAPTAPALADGAGTLLDEVQRLVDGLNRHWLVKSYIEPGHAERLVPPGIIDAPEAKP